MSLMRYRSTSVSIYSPRLLQPQSSALVLFAVVSISQCAHNY